MSDSNHGNHENIGFYGIHRTIRSNPETIRVFCSYEFFHTCWIRILRQLLNSLHDPRNGILR